MEHAQSIRATRPFAVTLVAGFQLFKAAYLLFLFEKWRVFSTLPGPGKIDSNALFRDLFVLFLPAAAIYSLAIGWGLWRMQRWARELLIAAIINCWMIGSVSFNGLLFGGGVFLDNLEVKVLVCVLVLNLLIYGCLAWYPGVAEAFGERTL
ncbi:MAG: hypothetical protein WAL75_24750 [Terracidiphilus sp.]